MKFRFYSDDLVDNPRSEERTEEVVGSWLDSRCQYEFEQPTDCADYYHIVAERILFRDVVMGFDLEREFVMLPGLHPFGEGGPKIKELASRAVSVGMALVPLTPEAGDTEGVPVLMRLYCVSGLAKQYPEPFPMGAGYEDCSWFVQGVPLGKGVVGESWRLAATLLRDVVKRRDVSAIRNLASRFIVTGDMDGKAVAPVKMGQKPLLATNDYPEYSTLKWMMPMKNKNDDMVAKCIPLRRIETPSTLEEALELVKTMQNRATSSMFRFIQQLDYEGVREQYENGADLFAVDPETKYMPLEMVNNIDLSGNALAPAGAIRKTPKDDQQKAEWNNSRRSIARFLRSKGADCAMCFYLLAKNRDEESLRGMTGKYSIDARDANGLAAVDWALIDHDWETIEVLKKHGARQVSVSHNPELRRVFTAIGRAIGKLNETDLRIVEVAAGLGVSVESDDCIELHDYLDRPIDDVTIFDAAVTWGHYPLLRKCLELGCNPNQKIVRYREVPMVDPMAPNDGPVLDRIPNQKDYPSLMVARNHGLSDDAKKKLQELLREFGSEDHGETYPQSEEVQNILKEDFSTFVETREKLDVLIRAVRSGLPPYVMVAYTGRFYAEECDEYDFPIDTIKYEAKCEVPLIYAAAKHGYGKLLRECCNYHPVNAATGIGFNTPMRVVVHERKDDVVETQVYLLDAVTTQDGKVVHAREMEVEMLKGCGATMHSESKNRFL